MDIELEMLVVTSTMVDVLMGTFVRGFVGFVVAGLGLVAPTVDATVDDSGLVVSVVVVVLLMYSGRVVFVVVLVIFVGLNFVVVLEDSGLGVVVPLPVVVLAVVDRTVVVLMLDGLAVVLVVGLGVVVLVADTF